MQISVVTDWASASALTQSATSIKDSIKAVTRLESEVIEVPDNGKSGVEAKISSSG
jgi:hypothetical protein